MWVFLVLCWFLVCETFSVSTRELSQNDLWGLSYCSDQDSSAPTVHFGQTSSGRKSLGWPKPLSYDTHGGCQALTNNKWSRFFFSPSLVIHFWFAFCEIFLNSRFSPSRPGSECRLMRQNMNYFDFDTRLHKKWVKDLRGSDSFLYPLFDKHFQTWT